MKRNNRYQLRRKLVETVPIWVLKGPHGYLTMGNKPAPSILDAWYTEREDLARVMEERYSKTGYEAVQARRSSFRRGGGVIQYVLHL